MKNIFLVKQEAKKVKMLNSFYISMMAEELKALADYLFVHYQIDIIEWNFLSVHLTLSNLPYPAVAYIRAEDNIAELPDTYADYLNTLGKQTKKHAKYYVGRMVRDFPSVEYIYKRGIEVTDEEFYAVCRFSSERMAYKSIKYGGASDEKLRIGIQHEAGFGFFVKIEGEVKAGCIGYVIGEHLYLSKIAHDVSMNNYNLGNVVLLKLIEYCIDHHIRHFHFLWGKNVDYKVRFGGVAYPLMNYAIFRRRGLAYYRKRLDVWHFVTMRRIHDYLKQHDRLWKTLRKIRYSVSK
ncbi:MAG: GNAT family N-acetyltransferase [Prevotella sp.]